MLCDICKKNNATILITKIVNGEKKELPYQTGKRDFEVKILISAKADSEY